MPHVSKSWPILSDAFFQFRFRFRGVFDITGSFK